MTTQIPWAPGAVYQKVLCRLGQPVPDGDDQDEYPDLLAQGGTVTITCNAKRIKYQEDDGRVRVLTTKPWTFQIRKTDGELYNPESGQIGVMILSGKSEGVDPVDFTWTAVVKPDNGDPFTVVIPAMDGGEVDLAEFSDVPPSPGTPIVRHGVPEGGDQGQALLKSSSNDYDVEWGDVEGVTGAVVSTTVTSIWTGTQEDYDSIDPKDQTTVYIIVEGD